MEIKINFEVSLSRETIDVLRQFAPDMPEKVCNGTAHNQELKTFVKETVVEFLEGLKKHAQPEENYGPAEEPAPQAPVEPAPAPAPEKTSGTQEITDDILRKAVKAAKDKSGVQSVKRLFGEFGIHSSSDCPQERRSELLDMLNNLAA